MNLSLRSWRRSSCVLLFRRRGSRCCFLRCCSRSLRRSRCIHASGSVLVQCAQPWRRVVGSRRKLAGQQRLERDHAPIERARIVLILPDDGAVQSDSRKHASRPGIRQYLRTHFPVCSTLGMSSDGTGRNRCIRTQLELACKQVTHTVLVHDDHDVVHCLSANLQAEATTFHIEERWSTPALISFAAGHAFSIGAADDKSALQERWNHGKALCGAQYLFRNTLVRS